jgi:anti-sigma-K factor RskA
LDIKEYISSGILELYVFGQLSEVERTEVERMAAQHPEVKSEIHEISKAIESYAIINGAKTPPDVRDSLFSKIKSDSNSTSNTNTNQSNSSSTSDNSKSSKWNGLNTALLILSAAALGAYFYGSSSWKAEKAAFEKNQIICDSLQKVNQTQYAIISDLKNENILIAKITATPKYKETVLHLHTSKSSKFNYLQLNNLPALASGEAYQLWALKDGQAPMPLSVFKDTNSFVKVDFVEDTKTYAITVEKEVGAESPNMENLVGTFAVE